MGKGKTRAYKHRLDKYYYLARSTGFRSRAAFKLIQLNQQYDFFANATCCLDLCAAPGGWSQVAAKYMPVGSQIVSIDLAPIKPIPRVVTLQADITSPKTHAKVRKLIQENRCDLVLNDGAPNVGAAWITDSTNQLDLCLASLKFATIFLKKGGTFVTKVFRSEHYNSLLWVFQNFFEHVDSTKPKASRDTSAELFVVCRGYLAPSHIDPKLLDSQFVFSDLDLLQQHASVPVSKQLTAIDFSTCSVADFIRSKNPIDILNTVNLLEFDSDPLSEAAATHPATTQEIRELCKDLKVIGRPDQKYLLKWQATLRRLLTQAPQKQEEEEHNEDLDSDEELQAAVEQLELKKRKEERLKRKRQEKVKNQLIKRLQKNMQESNDILDPATRYGKIETPVIAPEGPQKSFEELVEENLENDFKQNGVVEYENVEGELVGPTIKRSFGRHVEIKSDSDDDPDEQEQRSRQWYNNALFDSSSDDDIANTDDDDNQSETNDETNDQYENDQENANDQDENDQEITNDQTTENNENTEGEPQRELKGQSLKSFDATAYALAKAMLLNPGKKREIIDSSFNRYLHDDGPLPNWFVEDEKLYNQPMIPVTKDDVAEWKEKMRDVNEIATKRVVEARARKKAKALAKMKALQEKAAEVAEKEGLNERSKIRLMNQIYEKGMKKLQRETKVVVAQKKDQGRPSMPHNAKGAKVLFVDPRGKKEQRVLKKIAQGEVRRKPKKSKYIHRKK